ncbi:TetR/AcrR family transcriptional regulator [Gorillibacterium timonense]|uniref:TetR/AcrR family transcriptional regulator n=1 Tax=Gorillibacterium timonense TaxID=1689269 RepID=UPI00071D6914|nr:TetR family transcriptional regulator [Gorillibacterium timonense]
MSRKSDEVKKALLDATVALLHETQDAALLTVRQIADRAQVNIAMINYYFTSKDELVNQAIDLVLKDAVEQWLTVKEEDVDPTTRLINMLKQMADMVIQYYGYTKLSVTYQLVKGDMSVPLYLLPLLKEIYPDRKGEEELRLAAFVLITSTQAMLCRHEEFYKYSGFNAFDKKQRDSAIELLIHQIMKGMER